MKGITHRKSGRSRLYAAGSSLRSANQVLVENGEIEVDSVPASKLPGQLRLEPALSEDRASGSADLSTAIALRTDKPAHGEVTQKVLEVLARGDLTAFAELAIVVRQHLGSKARWGLAWAALIACDDQEIGEVIDAVVLANELMGEQ